MVHIAQLRFAVADHGPRADARGLQITSKARAAMSTDCGRREANDWETTDKHERGRFRANADNDCGTNADGKPGRWRARMDTAADANREQYAREQRG